MQPSANLAHQTFSPARFGRLLARHAAERGAGYLLSAAVLGGIMLLVMSYISFEQGGPLNEATQIVLFLLFLLGAGSFFSSGVFAVYGDKQRGMAALTLPASHLEKFLVGWVFSLPVFVVVFVALFYAVDALVLYGASSGGQAVTPINIFADPDKTNFFFAFYVLLNGAWLWGSIFFAKGQFVKMGFTLGLVTILGSVLNFRVLKSLLGSGLEIFPAPPFTNITLRQGGQFFSLEMPISQAAWLSALPLGLAALLWVAAYFRLTEKQL